MCVIVVFCIYIVGTLVEDLPVELELQSSASSGSRGLHFGLGFHPCVINVGQYQSLVRITYEP